MDKLERRIRIESLDDLKRIRFSTGSLFYNMSLFFFLLLALMFYGFAILFVVLHQWYLAVFFGIIGVLFELLEFYCSYKQEKVEEEYLLDYGRYYG